MEQTMVHQPPALITKREYAFQATHACQLAKVRSSVTPLLHALASSIITAWHFEAC